MLKNKLFQEETGDEAGAPKEGHHHEPGKVYFCAWSMDVKFEGENVVPPRPDPTTTTPPWQTVHLTSTRHAEGLGRVDGIGRARLPAECPDNPGKARPAQAAGIKSAEKRALRQEAGKKREKVKPPEDQEESAHRIRMCEGVRRLDSAATPQKAEMFLSLRSRLGAARASPAPLCVGHCGHEEGWRELSQVPGLQVEEGVLHRLKARMRHRQSQNAHTIAFAGLQKNSKFLQSARWRSDSRMKAVRAQGVEAQFTRLASGPSTTHLQQASKLDRDQASRSGS
jgi:hypothetical protein